MLQTSRTKAILWALLSALCFTCLTAVVKSTSTNTPISIPILILSRSFFGCLFLIPLAWENGLRQPQKKNLPRYALRAIIAFTTIFATYYAYGHLPLHIATSIGYTEPMMQVAISILFLRATVSRHDWISIFLGIIGAVIVAYGQKKDAHISFNAVMLVALLANLLASVAKGITKKLTQHEPTHQIMFYGYLLNFFMALAFLAFNTSKIPTETPPLSVIALLLLMALLSSISNYAYTKALSLTDIHVLSPVSYTKLLFALPFGFFLFQEIPTSSTLAGSLIIMMANFLALKQDSKSSAQK